jgi:hypothetical protein
MEKEFIPFKEAKDLKKLGFNMQTFGVFENNKLGKVKVILHISYTDNPIIPEEHKDRSDMFKVDNRNSTNPQWLISAPTYQQAFKWFRVEYGLIGDPIPLATSYPGPCDSFGWGICSSKNTDDWENEDGSFSTYEEAELDCIRKLIEIVKKK